MRPTRRLALLPLTLLLTGCVPKIQISSMPTRSQAATLDRVFLVVGTGPGGSGQLMDLLNSALSGQLSQQGVAAKGWVRNFLALDEDAKLRAELERFHPHQVLRIEQTSSTTTNGNTTGTSLDLQVNDARTGESIWKARLTYEGSASDSADLMATRIVGALRQDGLMPAAGTPTK